MATSRKPKPETGGAPRWTYSVGAIVGVAALLWGIVSYFIPRPEAARPAPALPSVNVSGSHNVGIGVMTGNTFGTSPTTPAASAPAAAGTSRP